MGYFNCKTIFLTATPYRRGQPILSGRRGETCYEISLNELMERGVIRRTIFRQIGTIDDKDTERKSVRKLKLFNRIQFFVLFEVIMYRNSTDIK